MSGKIKLLLVVLALGALVSVYYAFSLLGSASNSDKLSANASKVLAATNPAALDTDHDGLSNRDEEYWGTDPNKADTDGDGFLDGEEVVSGHNPRKPGPDDYLDPGQNLTKRTIQLLAGGIAMGDLNPASPSYNVNMKNLAQAMASQYTKNTSIVVDKFETVADTPESKLSYVKNIANALVDVFYPASNDLEGLLKSIGDVGMNDFTSLTNNTKRYSNFSQTANKIAAADGERASRLASIPVPKSFASQHTSAITLLRTEQKLLVILSNLKADPLQGGMALDRLLQLQYDVLPRFIYDLSKALETKL